MITIPSQALRALAAIAPKNDPRNINGIHICQIGGELHAVASNGYVLVRYSWPGTIEAPVLFTAPKPSDLSNREGADCVLDLENGWIEDLWNERRTGITLLTGEFPEWQRADAWLNSERDWPPGLRNSCVDLSLLTPIWSKAWSFWQDEADAPVRCHPRGLAPKAIQALRVTLMPMRD